MMMVDVAVGYAMLGSARGDLDKMRGRGWSSTDDGWTNDEWLYDEKGMRGRRRKKKVQDFKC